MSGESFADLIKVVVDPEMPPGRWELRQQAAQALRDWTARENERLRRENRALMLTAAILLRKLGGEALISEAEQVREDAVLVRVPARDGYRLLLSEKTRLPVSGIRRVQTDSESEAC